MARSRSSAFTSQALVASSKLFVIGGLVLLAGCAKSNQNVATENQHIFISHAPLNWSNPLPISTTATFTTPADRVACETALRKAVCDTTLSSSQISQQWNHVTCAPDSEEFVAPLMVFYDEMPARLRPSLCSIYKIFISDGITSTAFASPVYKSMSELPVAAYIGARKSTFLKQPTVHAIVSWKEQLPFGGSSDFLANDPKLLQIEYGIKSNLAADGLFYVLVHELGHLIDFNNHGVNTNCGPVGDESDCEPIPGTFSALSWKTGSTPLSNAAYLKQSEFCYYNCTGGTLPGDEAFDIYSSMVKSAFITPYSGVNAREDFAEFFVWNLMSRYKGVNYQVQFPGHGTIDMNQGLTNSPIIKAKLDFMDKLWNSPDLKISNQ